MVIASPRLKAATVAAPRVNWPSWRQISSTVIEAGQNPIFVSAASAWEMSIKQAQGKLDIPDDLEAECGTHRFQPLPITVRHALVAGQLPRHHGDPFDRMLIAQAQLHQLTVVTHDPRFALYGIPVLWT